ncbi:unnamed protein product [Didymodactylos carnosus]|uniref:Uncharacterized protein n=1 Tax=Didymodactylos carnosus TaxID=1234261 RepID=A0A815HL93_9BILA|nr:unnamed protein product [Didymodactylos carnosus]CAF1353282.1 unnamed protein product [Didymodactylos carnosus]CAF4007001.1 unnamed protein product [Didymodactylos carnosus]CAF4225077.1 unnamed protein product [Didymodactylos carnosus]
MATSVVGTTSTSSIFYEQLVIAENRYKKKLNKFKSSKLQEVIEMLHLCINIISNEKSNENYNQMKNDTQETLNDSEMNLTLSTKRHDPSLQCRFFKVLPIKSGSSEQQNMIINRLLNRIDRVLAQNERLLQENHDLVRHLLHQDQPSPLMSIPALSSVQQPLLHQPSFQPQPKETENHIPNATSTPKIKRKNKIQC